MCLLCHFAENNGGKAQFHKETGITESDWYGKLWLRWNDVVADAGLVPNEMQAGISNEHVLDRYAEACRHCGKPPSKAELRFYVQKTHGFISPNTFANHFGSRDAVISALRDRAVERGEHDLIAILPEVSSPQVSQDEARLTTMRDGWVYLL